MRQIERGLFAFMWEDDRAQRVGMTRFPPFPNGDLGSHAYFFKSDKHILNIDPWFARLLLIQG